MNTDGNNINYAPPAAAWFHHAPPSHGYRIVVAIAALMGRGAEHVSLAVHDHFYTLLILSHMVRLPSLVILQLLLSLISANAVEIKESELSGSETAIDFNRVSRNERVTEQFASLGVKFDGNAFGNNFPSTINGTQDLANFTSDPDGPDTIPMTMRFNVPQRRIGFIIGGTDSIVRAYLVEAFSVAGNQPPISKPQVSHRIMTIQFFLQSRGMPTGNQTSIFAGRQNLLAR